jgi:hypothetical protein
MSSLYERLFKYRASDRQTPLENYLTEALCDLLNRIGEENAQAQANLLHMLFACHISEVVDFRTQVPVRLSSKNSRIPDLVGWRNGKVVCLVEVKVNAGFTGETSAGAAVQDEAEDSSSREANSHQLKAYGKWLENHHPEAKIVLLTYRTQPPSDFFQEGGEYGVPVGNRHVLHWQTVYNALDAHAGSGQACSILVKDFCQFLQTRGIAMPSLDHNELDTLKAFVGTGTAEAVQRFMNSLRDQCKDIAQNNGIACSWAQDLSYQYGGQFISDHTLIGWVKMKDLPAQISWGFHFDQSPMGESPDPFGFQKLFRIPQGSGIFLNLVHDEESTFPEDQTPSGEDWYPCEKGAKAQAPAVAFKLLCSCGTTKEIGTWFQEKFIEICKFIKTQEK